MILRQQYVFCYIHYILYEFICFHFITVSGGNQAIYGQDKRKQKQLINTILTVEQGIIQNILCTLAGVID